MLPVSNTLQPLGDRDEWVRNEPEPGRAEAAVLTASIVIAVLVSAAVGVLVFFLLIYGW
jgi:hypothetical protein